MGVVGWGAGGWAGSGRWCWRLGFGGVRGGRRRRSVRLM